MPSAEEPALGAIRRRLVGPHRAVASPPSPQNPAGPPGGAAPGCRPGASSPAPALVSFAPGASGRPSYPRTPAGAPVTTQTAIAARGSVAHIKPRGREGAERRRSPRSARSFGARMTATVVLAAGHEFSNTVYSPADPLTGDAHEPPCDPFAWLTGASPYVQDAGSTIQGLAGTLSRHLPGCQPAVSPQL